MQVFRDIRNLSNSGREIAPATNKVMFDSININTPVNSQPLCFCGRINPCLSIEVGD